MSIPPEVRDYARTSWHNARQDNSPLPSAADFFVPSLPGAPNLASNPTHPLYLYAGELPSYPGEGNGGGEGATGKDARIFFMMAKARRSAGRPRVIFWFNGGPGCSSFDGSLMEVGPFRTVPAAQTESGFTEVKLVEGGWEEYATMVFVDQPPGVGLSYSPTNGHLRTLEQASQHLIQFMVNFYKVFPELAEQDTYLAGESFAGQYIPYFADALLNTKRLRHFHLEGIAIGNGWIDPVRQYPAYQEFAYTKGLIKKGTPEGDTLDRVTEECNKAIAALPDQNKVPVDILQCEGVMRAVVAPFKKEINGKTVCMNIYDVRKTDDFPDCGLKWPPDIADVTDFLRRKDVVSALHATMHEGGWIECNNAGAKLDRNGLASVHLLPGILDRGVKVLMFAGNEDLICNHIGIENMIDALEWGGAKGFGANTTASAWSVNGTDAGEWTVVRNLTYAKIYDGSHMVGYDVPHVTNDMIMRFMGVDLNELPGATGQFGSKVGDNERKPVHFGELQSDEGIPLLKGGRSDWEAWYNAMSAVLILFTLAGIVLCYFYFRRRRLRRNAGGVSLGSTAARDSEERVPFAEDYELQESTRRDKGKGRAVRDDDGRDDEEAERGQSVFALEDEHED